MKKFIIAIAFLGIAGISLAAGGENPRAAREFAERFRGAENVRWSNLKDGYICVSFTLNGVRAEGYFNQYAEFVGTARNLFFNQLPITVMQEVNARYSGSEVIEVVEINNAQGVSYKLVLEKGNRKLTIKMDSMGTVIAEQKEKIKK